MNSNELLDAVKVRHELPSDYALARLLKVEPQSVQSMRRKGLSDDRALQIATLLGLNPGEVLAMVHAERAKDPEVKRAWEKLVKTVRSAAAGMLVMLGIAISAPEPVQASQGAYPAIHYANRRREAWRAAGAGILAFLRGLSTLFSGDARMLRFLSLPLALCTATANASDWTDQDMAWQAAYLILHTADWGQTLDIAKNPGDYYEVNPLLGDHPSVKRANSYMAFSALTHTGIAYTLPPPWRRRFQQVTIGLKAGIVGYNYSIGLRINF